jgi:hypothetical protein
MGQRCGCVGRECNCGIVGTETVFIESGSGGAGNPYALGRSSQAFFQSGGQGAQVGVTGAGTAADPYSISANITSSGRRLESAVFTSSGSWTRPTGVQLFQVTLIGGGGGGAAAGAVAFGPTTYFSFAGMGGDGGAVQRMYVYLPAGYTYATVTVGAGGAGGTITGGPPSTGGWGVGWPTSGGVTSVQFKGDAVATREYIAVGGRSGLTFWDSGSDYREPEVWSNSGQGMWPGQKVTVNGQSPGAVSGIAAGAGGPGNWSGGMSGGTHSLYDGRSNGLILAGGNGGTGGSTSATTGQGGGDGWKYGGGGGGGGSTSNGYNYNGGHGGAGASGLVVITEL